MHIFHRSSLPVIPNEKLGFLHQTLGHPEGGQLEVVFIRKVLLLLIPFELFILLMMTKNTKIDEKLEGADNFRAWKYQIMLILEEKDL